MSKSTYVILRFYANGKRSTTAEGLTYGEAVDHLADPTNKYLPCADDPIEWVEGYVLEQSL